MKELTKFLLEKGALHDDTLYWIVKHQKWCESYGATPETIKPNEVIVYIEELTLQYQNKEKVNKILRRIRWYYEFLIHEQKIKANPLENKHIETAKKRIFKYIVSIQDVPNRKLDPES